MEKRITLKPATMDDAAILLQWRNDPETRKMSHDKEIIEKADHLNWLSETLENPDKQLFIAWEKIEESPFWHNENQSKYHVSIVKPVGTIRIDYDLQCNCYELSWTVAPDSRGRKIGKRIVSIVANQYKDKYIRAEISSNNIASIKIAEFIGMRFNYKNTIDDVLHYFRGEIK